MRHSFQWWTNASGWTVRKVIKDECFVISQSVFPSQQITKISPAETSVPLCSRWCWYLYPGAVKVIDNEFDTISKRWVFKKNLREYLAICDCVYIAVNRAWLQSSTYHAGNVRQTILNSSKIYVGIVELPGLGHVKIKCVCESKYYSLGSVSPQLQPWTGNNCTTAGTLSVHVNLRFWNIRNLELKMHPGYNYPLPAKPILHFQSATGTRWYTPGAVIYNGITGYRT